MENQINTKKTFSKRYDMFFEKANYNIFLACGVLLYLLMVVTFVKKLNYTPFILLFLGSLSFIMYTSIKDYQSRIKSIASLSNLIHSVLATKKEVCFKVNPKFEKYYKYNTSPVYSNQILIFILNMLNNHKKYKMYAYLKEDVINIDIVLDEEKVYSFVVQNYPFFMLNFDIKS